MEMVVKWLRMFYYSTDSFLDLDSDTETDMEDGSVQQEEGKGSSKA